LGLSGVLTTSHSEAAVSPRYSLTSNTTGGRGSVISFLQIMRSLASIFVLYIHICYLRILLVFVSDHISSAELDVGKLERMWKMYLSCG